jgi:two-component system sensor histidine kinase DesK
MLWLTNVVRLAIAPVFLGAVLLWLEEGRSWRDVGAGIGLVALTAIHLYYWRRPWPAEPRRVVVAAAAMVVTNLTVNHLLGLSQPLLWLYPALVVGAGLRAPAAAVCIGLLAAVAVFPMAAEESLFVRALGPSHWMLLSIVLAGLAMTAVRQLISVNADLHATRAELAELAVAGERERMARELHDLLGRTLSLIAVKAELASRLSANGDPAAETELRDVQRLARHAVRDVRDAVAGDRRPSLAAELVAARRALRTAGIDVTVEGSVKDVNPAHEATLAWVLREAVTNVVKHSGAATCRISIDVSGEHTTLEVVDDGRGAAGDGSGMGLAGLADRVRALGGTLEVGPRSAGGFSLCAKLGAETHAPARAEVG